MPEDAGTTGDPQAPPPAPAPARQPVDLTRVDPATALEQAKPAIALAASVTDTDTHTFTQLTGAVIESIVSGNSITLGSICTRAQISTGHVREHFTPEWAHCADLAIRAMQVQADDDVLCEELFSTPVPVGRGNGLGTDKLPGKGPSLHMIGRALGSADRHLVARSYPLTTGTRDDHSSQRADPQRIAAFAELLGHRPAGTIAEHVAALLDSDLAVRRLLIRSQSRDIGAFQQAGITPRDLAKSGFSDLLLVPPLPHGPGTATRLSSGPALPGTDEDTIEAIQGSGRTGILYAGERSDAQHRDLGNAGFEQLPPRKLDLSYALDIRSAPWGVEIWWSRELQLFARREVGQGARTELWRLVNPPDDLSDVRAVIEQHHQKQWPQDCLDAWVTRCEPGKLQNSRPAPHGGCTALMAVANAAVVDADRRALRQQLRKG